MFGQMEVILLLPRASSDSLKLFKQFYSENVQRGRGKTLSPNCTIQFVWPHNITVQTSSMMLTANLDFSFSRSL